MGLDTEKMSNVNVRTSPPYDRACEILQKTNDGEELSGSHLRLVEMMVNGNDITEKMEVEFEKLYENVRTGYVKPWLFGIRHMTADHEGYIYWRGRQVEHYSHDSYKGMRQSAKDLERRALILESRGIKVTFGSLFMEWNNKSGPCSKLTCHKK